MTKVKITIPPEAVDFLTAVLHSPMRADILNAHREGDLFTLDPKVAVDLAMEARGLGSVIEASGPSAQETTKHMWLRLNLTAWRAIEVQAPAWHNEREHQVAEIWNPD